MTCGHPSCAVFKGKCEACVRRARYGLIIAALTTEVDEIPLASSTLDALDALADVMRDRHELLARHRKEMFEEQREAQRGARDAFAEGRFEGQREGGDRW
jgi:hypothetical protein